MNLLQSAKAKAMTAWVALPWAGRLTAVIVLVCAAYFFWTSTPRSKARMLDRAAPKRFTLGASTSPPGHLAAESSTPPLHVTQAAAAKLVREAAESAKRAAAAENPYQQLLHVQWAMAKLESAREVTGGNTEALSAMSGVHVGKLEAFLEKAQEMCAQRLESVATAAS
jgi:hypothetical protein